MQSPAPQNVVQLAATATQELEQDFLSITLSVTREGTDAASVQGQLKSALEAGLTEARKAVQPGQLDVRTGQFGLFPRYGRDNKLNGWQGSAELVLDGRDFARITGTASRLVTLNVSSVNFSLSRATRSKTEAEVQLQAIERFKTRAADIARGFGFSGYTLREVSVSAGEQDSPMRPRMVTLDARAASAEAPLPVQAGRTLVSAQVSGTVVLK